MFSAASFYTAEKIPARRTGYLAGMQTEDGSVLGPFPVSPSLSARAEQNFRLSSAEQLLCVIHQLVIYQPRLRRELVKARRVLVIVNVQNGVAVRGEVVAH
jgi:hypothetical protein